MITVSARSGCLLPSSRFIHKMPSPSHARPMCCPSRELLGPVTAIAALEGLLVVAAGKSVEVHEWVSTSLSHVTVQAPCTAVDCCLPGSVTTCGRYLITNYHVARGGL